MNKTCALPLYCSLVQSYAHRAQWVKKNAEATKNHLLFISSLTRVKVVEHHNNPEIWPHYYLLFIIWVTSRVAGLLRRVPLKSQDSSFLCDLHQQEMSSVLCGGQEWNSGKLLDFLRWKNETRPTQRRGGFSYQYRPRELRGNLRQDKRQASSEPEKTRSPQGEVMQHLKNIDCSLLIYKEKLKAVWQRNWLVCSSTILNGSQWCKRWQKRSLIRYWGIPLLSFRCDYE